MLTATQQFIEDAIKGGYEKIQLPDAQTFIGEGKTISVQCGDHLLLDPLAWQAVGKTRGWGIYICSECNREWQTDYEERQIHHKNCVREKMKGEYQKDARHYMHRFIDHLADGNTIEEALIKLL